MQSSEFQRILSYRFKFKDKSDVYPCLSLLNISFLSLFLASVADVNSSEHLSVIAPVSDVEN